ncbi:conserved hypothetical protein [Leishmania infantum JPCM5]|uniref:Flagellum_targeting_protein_kharon1_-_putative n=2 Tax=Leishmania infantum TaxID=5671 RepID=A0A6L0XT61_LEIIN|nr:conserved hypothetical protein [Leishmania infantum JPCM5]CAC9552789.1 flagellum_targeting_protein_kharon1_-_putative [Leishmania infantum]CAM73086.1 conserved hypothetical protein [Leishmania infantum JPCM5]SUZ46992.1 flagellum_targeting_protein_kharon1_-_putative [Leishmania infantum]|eukprot:XP_001469967.1 conserved hypothetical protein [Leishmania infantum JPCM5]
MTQETSPQRNSEPAGISPRQRARKNRSGENAARVIMGLDLASDSAERRPNPGRQHCAPPRNNFSSPREFFAGPSHPPRMFTGIRRYPNCNRDSVGTMLTDEYFMTSCDDSSITGRSGGALRRASSRSLMYAASGAYGTQAKRGEGTSRQKKARKRGGSINGATALLRCRDGLTNNCIVTAPEAPWRCGVKITHPQGAMEAPYFEDNDPRPPRDAPPVTGKRHVPPPHKDAKMFGQVPPPQEGEEDLFQSTLPPCHKTSNKANESVDVLNLHSYTADELNEKPQPFKQLGPRKCSAPELPPRKPPVIKPINTPAKQEHDVLGTGRWGSPEKEQPRGLARGLCRPPHDTANLFHGGMPQPDEKAGSTCPQESVGSKGGSLSARTDSRQPRVIDSRRTGSRSGSVSARTDQVYAIQGEPHRASSPGSRVAARPSRQVEAYHVDSRSRSPKKREDPVFDDSYRPHRYLFKKNAGNPNILHYYDPTIDPMPAAAPKRPIPRSNMESKLDDLNTPQVIGKARGEFYKNSRSSIALI